jgi:NAD(P)-dependent dehydrogenase (short-subunit alcohol dehydrogenase family)
MGVLDGKTCILTGGNGSIGLATARLFLAEGARVMLADLVEGESKAGLDGIDPTGSQWLRPTPRVPIRSSGVWR